jgi:hypothetical protein
MEEIDYSEYNTASAEYQINLATTSGLNIGSAVNANMIDDIMSDPVNKASMLADLKGRNLLDRYEWLLNVRPSYTTAFLATNLELIIDAAVKDPSLMEALSLKADEMNPALESGWLPQGMMTGVQGFLSEFHKAQLVYPRCMVNRIPKTKRDTFEEGGYVLALSEQCKAMEAIKNMRDQLEQLFTKNEYLLARKADAGFANQLSPRTTRVRHLVEGVPNDHVHHPGVRRFWRQIAAEEFSIVRTEEESSNVFASMCAKLDIALMSVKDDIEDIAVELYRNLYNFNVNTPQRDASTNKFRHYHDGLLWTNKLANAFINRIVDRKMGGLILNVQLYAERQFAVGVHQVRIDTGIVYNPDTNQPIGETHPKLRPGKYAMEDGLLYVRQPSHNALLPKYEVLEMIEPLAAERY